jgi:hypothetical protein
MEKYDRGEKTDAYEKPVITDHGTLVDLTANPHGQGFFHHHPRNWLMS